MFSKIPSAMIERMRYLEEADAADRIDGTAREQRLRQIPPETGRFIAIIAASSPPGRGIEIGTSAGYSGLWLSLACRERAQKLITIEILPEKVRLAQETFRLAGVDDIVELVNADACEHVAGLEDISFCFLDAEKNLYDGLYDLIVPRMVPGGLLVADNVISHADVLGALVDKAARDERVDSVVVPIGKGELVCRKV